MYVHMLSKCCGSSMINALASANGNPLDRFEELRLFPNKFFEAFVLRASSCKVNKGIRS